MASTYRRLNQFVAVGLSAACGSLATYYGFNKRWLNVDNEKDYYTVFENRESKWDSNWDRRDPKSLVKPVDPNNSKLQNEYNKQIEEKKSRATRHIFLIRHGQYNLNGETDEERKLTELGRRQALLTGERLSLLNYPWTSITQSTMTRAIETCSLIQKHLPANLPLYSSDLLREGAPVPPDPPNKHWKPELYQFYRDGARIEAAFRKFIHRAPPEQKENSYEIIVCHGNVIRYFVMRTLQLTPEAWLRLGIDHASITALSIYPNGRASLRSFSNSGFMPPDAISS